MTMLISQAFVLLLLIFPTGICQIFNEWEEHPWESQNLNCEQGLREFDPVTQKQRYTIGIHAPAGVETAYREFNLTFQDYLNEAVGKRFEPPIEFALKATNRPLRDWLDRGEEIDFVYTDTGIFSCIGTEVGAQPLATTVARLTSHGREYELDVFAGTMMVRSDNREINSVADLKDKVIGAQNFFDFAGGQAQFYVMYKNGVDFVVDPKQVIFTANNEDTVQGVLDGRWDVGFVRTGQVERTINPATGDFIDPDLVKVIDPRIHRLDDGTLFPFLHTTPVFPEWPLAARNHVDRIVSEEVAAAMINMGYHSSIGEAIQNCREEATTNEQLEICNTMPPTFFDQKARCDTTRELAELAFQAGKAGFHNGFRPPRSHFSVRTMQQDAGFIIQDEVGDWHCERDDTLYDGIFCPEGYYKVAEEVFESQCEKSGSPCPDGYSCYCKPCIKAYEVNVYPAETSNSAVVSDFNREFGCAKMDVCAKVEQGKTITMNAFDNLQRSNATVRVVGHFGEEERELAVHQVEDFLYEFDFSHSTRGIVILEIYADGVQISESPIQVNVVERNCDLDFPGQNRISSAIGECECEYGFIEIRNECVSNSAREVSIFQLANDTMADIDNNKDQLHHLGCDKMSLCGVVEQTKDVVFLVYDNLERSDASLSVLMHLGAEKSSLPLRKIQPYLYEFGFSRNERGVAILEIYVDGVQIPESPVRVEIKARVCDDDFPGQGMIANNAGLCECPADALEIGSQCMQTGTFAAIMASIGALILLFFGWCYLGYRRRKSDEMWHINHEELNFNHPVDVIGQGAFGVVILADYRGTKVAIKRVIPDDDELLSGSVAFNVSSKENSGSSPAASNEDLENGITSVSSPDGTSPGSAERSRSIDHIDWINGMIVGGKKSFFQRTFPSLFPDDKTRAKLHILGSAARPAGKRRRRSLNSCLPRCDDHSRRQQEFVHEMRLLSRLRHPCITTVMGAVMGGFEPMMVMEYMENGSLYDLLRNETVYTGGEIILQILRDVAQGLRFLHASNPPIVHRDLKAKNILIDSRFRAKVADFGLAIKTKNGMSGTPYWMAPEYLLQNTAYNRSCDVYAFGMIIYEIYSRKIPYQGADPREVLRKVCDPRINYRPRVPVTCPRRMAEIMKKCWSGNPTFRPEAKDLDMLFTDMTANDAEPLIEEGNTRLRTEVAAGDMLYKVFPKKVADQLKAGQKVEPETHDDVTVFFSDIVGFTDISRKLSPVKVCNMLDRLYLSFDNLANKHEVFKVETIGDAWVGVTNLENNQIGTHAKRIAEFAIDAVAAASEVPIDEEDPSKGCVNIRVGFHSGPVVSNVIGSLNPRYGLFGDTMNTAARMEGLSVSGRIHCSEASARLLKEQAPDLAVRRRGKVAVKGKGNMVTYWVGGSTDGSRTRTNSYDSLDISLDASIDQALSAGFAGTKTRGKWPRRGGKKTKGGVASGPSGRDLADSAPAYWKIIPPSSAVAENAFSQ